MKTTFILAFILLLLSFHSNAQQTIDKLNVNQLKLPKESSNKALILDGAGQVKSSSTISDTELGYLEGLSDTLVNLLSGKANDSDVVKLSGNQSVDGIKTFTGKLVASSTVNGSIPCPVMTEAQRDLFTPVEGDCVYNSDTLKLNVFDGSVWKDVGGAGGISLWLTGNPYNVNDIVIESDKIYRCLIAHTSGTFATDLGAGNWGEVSQGLTSPVALADGGTGAVISPLVGSIIYVDADSFEQLIPGTPGQILQLDGSSLPFWADKTEYVSPNNLETSISSTQVLLESGNKNILTNPSFENSSFDSGGWVNSAGSFTENFANKVDGAKSARLVLSSQTMSLTQSSVLYQSSFADGVQGLASVWLKSDVALKVCAVQAGVVSTSLCVDVQANNKWGLYKVPFILGATSNGISIASTGAVTGTVYIDDAFVGAASLTQNMSACNDVSCETEFSAKVSATGVVSDENLDWISSISGSAGVYTLTISGFTVAPNCTLGMREIANNRIPRIDSTTASQVIIRTRDTGFSDAAGAFNIACQKQGVDFTAAKQLSNGNTYSSTNADTDWRNISNVSAGTFITATTTNPTFGTVAVNRAQWKRQGSDLLLRWDYRQTSAGTAGSGIYLLNIPSETGCVIDLNKAPANTGTTNASSGVDSTVGKFFVADTANDGSGSVYVYSSTQLKASFIYAGASVNRAWWSSTGAQFSSSGIVSSIEARVPCVGWQNSNIIIGQFNGLESCSSTLDCTDTFSAKVSAAGVVSGENVDWLNGNCSTASPNVTCTFNSSIFTIAPNCVATVNANSNASLSIQLTSSATNFVFNGGNGGGFQLANATVVCQKQGVDYIGKTAKAVASDQNLRTPGLTNGIVLSATVGGSTTTACTSSPCPYLDQTGGYITSVTRSAVGSYVMNFNKTFEKLKCSHTQIVGAAAGIVLGTICTSCNSIPIFARNTVPAAQDAGWDTICVGY